MNDVLELETRRDIYDLIAKNPGLHARKISEILSLSGQLTDYHLQYLEKHEVITSTKGEGKRRYYIKGTIGIKEKKTLAFLRQETSLRIILFLLQHPNSLHKDILDHIDIAKSTLSYHLEKLVVRGVISAIILEMEKTYSVTNEQEISELLIRYKPYSRIKSFKDTWINLQWPGVENK